MTFAQAIILGAVQGATEFLPISSSAHLVLVPWFLGWQDQGLTFDVMLHAGTLIAILSFFWRDWFEMVASISWKRGGHHAISTPDSRLLAWVICGTVPAAIAGFLLQKAVETTFRSPLVMAFTLIAVALLLWLAERTARLKKGVADISFTDALCVGFAQALALVPGTSRSGITITAGLFRGLKREAAARFSFLLSAPIIGGAGLKKVLDLRHASIAAADRLPMLLGFFSSLLVGYLTIQFLMKYLQRNTLFLFIYYRIGLGFVILGLIAFAGFHP